MQLLAREHEGSGCSTVGSAPRSGRGGRKFESSHPDTTTINESPRYTPECLGLLGYSAISKEIRTLAS